MNRFSNLPKIRRLSQIGGTRRNTRGGGYSFRDSWRPPLSSDPQAKPAQIILFPGEYSISLDTEYQDRIEGVEQTWPIYPFYQHYIPSLSRFETCGKGLSLFTDPEGNKLLDHGKDHCFYCEDTKAFGKSNLYFGYNVIVLGDFHCLEYTDRTTGRERTEWVECEGRNCPACRHGEPIIHHRRAFWKVPEMQADLLRNREVEKLQRRCKHCGGDMVDVGAECRGCKRVILVLDQSGMDAKEFQSYLQTPTECEACHEYDYPEPVRECQKCQSAESLELWDVQLELLLRDVGGAGKNGRRSQLDIIDWRPITDEGRKALSELSEPFDFTSMFSPRPYSEQERYIDRAGQKDNRRDYEDRRPSRDYRSSRVDYEDTPVRESRQSERGPRSASSFDRPSFRPNGGGDEEYNRGERASRYFRQ